MTSPAVLAARRRTSAPQPTFTGSVTVLTRHVGDESIIYALHSNGREILDRRPYGEPVEERIIDALVQLVGEHDGVVLPYGLEPIIEGKPYRRLQEPFRGQIYNRALQGFDAAMGSSSEAAHAAVAVHPGDGGYGICVVYDNGRSKAASGRYSSQASALAAAVEAAVNNHPGDVTISVPAPGDYSRLWTVRTARENGRTITLSDSPTDARLAARAAVRAEVAARYVTRARR